MNEKQMTSAIERVRLACPKLYASDAEVAAFVRSCGGPQAILDAPLKEIREVANAF